MIRVGILGCSNIAFNRFMPAALTVDGLKVTAIAEQYDKSKVTTFCEKYPLSVSESFDELINRPDIDAVYVPQPPAFHFEWAKKTLEAGKHVLVEKPSTTSYNESKDLVNLACANNLALHENYMFQYHSQIQDILNIVDTGAIGEVRMYRMDFGFPMRASNDFRYNKDLGGGALLDAGGYTLRLAAKLLGADTGDDSIEVKTAELNFIDGYDVDMYGTATLENRGGATAQVSFGMDCGYKCSLEIWGSKGTLFTNRIFTAPDGYEPIVTITTNDGVETIKLNSDNHFKHSIERFLKETNNNTEKQLMYQEILTQARLVEEVRIAAEQGRRK